MTEKKSQDKSGGSHAGTIMAGIAGVTAAAIGGYYLYGHKDAPKNRAKVCGWMLKAKGEVVEEFEKGKKVTESAYMNAVDTVARKYNELKNVDIDELEAFVMEMRDHWQGIKETMGKKTRVMKSKTKNTKTTKKTGK